MKTIFLNILILMSLKSFSQEVSLISGRWFFHSLKSGVTLDSSNFHLKSQLYQDLTFHFSPDGNFSSQIMKRNETGQWILNKSKKQLTLNSKNGSIIEINIISITKNEFIIRFANEILKLYKL